MSFISHEIKNSLNMILATMQLLEKKAEKNIYPKDILNHIELVKQNSFRIMKIVNDLSSKSKIELGYLDFNPSNEDIVFTNKLIEIGKLNNIPVLDHIVIGRNCYYSFFEEG